MKSTRYNYSLVTLMAASQVPHCWHELIFTGEGMMPSLKLHWTITFGPKLKEASATSAESESRPSQMDFRLPRRSPDFPWRLDRLEGNLECLEGHLDCSERDLECLEEPCLP